MKHIAVLGAQVPFTRGGAELLNESLVAAINEVDGLTAELIQLPFKWYQEEQILNDIMSWRLLDITEANGKKIDLVICTKFPTYAVDHPNKVLWLVHQHRYLYDLEFTKYDGLCNAPNAKKIRDKIRNLDSKFIKECKKIYTIAQTVTDRLNKYNDIDSTPIFPPPVLSKDIYPGTYDDYILYVGRLEVIKRADLIIKAAKKVKNAKIILAGKGSELDNIRKYISVNNLGDRCKALGYVEDNELLEYLANARAVFYGPVDEDYGYATIEAFLAKKPVITFTDSGEVEKMVSNTGCGFICEPDESSLADVIKEIYSLSNKDLKKMSLKGHQLGNSICWDVVLDKLVWENLE